MREGARKRYVEEWEGSADERGRVREEGRLFVGIGSRR